MRLLPTVLLGGLLALAAFTAASPAYAKTPAPPAVAAAKPEDEVTKFETAVNKLGLSAEQKPKVASLIKEVRASLKKIEATTDPPAVKQQQFAKLRNGAKEKLDHILTVAQDRDLKKLLGGPKAPR